MASHDIGDTLAPITEQDAIAGRYVPDPEYGLSGRLCRATAALQRAAAQHDLQGIRRTAKDLRALALQFRIESLVWHAQAIHDLEFAQPHAQTRLYMLLGGLEAALENTLVRLRLH